MIGLAPLMVAPAIVRFESLMPVRRLVLPVAEPLGRGIQYQTWPFGAARPEFYTTGSVYSPTGVLEPLSYWLESLEKHRAIYPDLAWELYS